MSYEFFWKNKSPYSQWHKCKFEDDKNTYSSTEQYMMYKKAILFNDNNMAEKILKSKDVRRIKEFGRKVTNFDLKIWETNREEIVYDGNMLKFSQNPVLKKTILESKNKILVESSPYDKIWGNGLTDDDPRALDPTKWLGLNLLGKCLMKVRQDLKENYENWLKMSGTVGFIDI